MPRVGVQLSDECVSSTCEEVMADDFATPELRRQKQDDAERRGHVHQLGSWLQPEGRVAELGKEED